jgi:hypothetical protein
MTNNGKKTPGVVEDVLPPPTRFDKMDKIIILCFACIFLVLFIWLIYRGDQPIFAYWTFYALLTLIFVGFLAATGLIRTRWMVIGGGAAVYGALILLTKDTNEIHMNDPAMQALQRYFDCLKIKDFTDAYALVSDARIAQREKTYGQDHYVEYVSSFDHTFEYKDFSYQFKAMDGGNPQFTVSYDVTDKVPRNEIFENRKQLISSVFAIELLGRDGITKNVVNNFNQYYITPSGVTAGIIEGYVSEYVRGRTIDDLFDPFLIADFVKSLKHSNIMVEPKQYHPEDTNVTRRYLHTITMVQQKDGWKILQGLGTPLVFNY